VELMSIGLFFLVLALVAISKGLYVVRQSEVVVIERLGRFHTILQSGVNLTIPFIDIPRAIVWMKENKVGYHHRIDFREMVLDIEEQHVITRDNVTILIDAIMYVQITDVRKAVYEVANLPSAAGQLAQTTLRSLIGEMELDQTLSNRDQINNQLKQVLDTATDKWGLKVNRVELKNISTPKDVQASMEKQMQAERLKRAAVLEAQGDKEARIARSEGERQERINQAQGEREAQIQVAQGEAQAVELVALAHAEALKRIMEAVGGDGDLAVRYLTAINYLEKFGAFAQGKGDKVYIPYEASGTLSALGSIQNLFGRQP
jgi:regulator of protease activity HflC (stomatin/prohibitin superfamily)